MLVSTIHLLDAVAMIISRSQVIISGQYSMMIRIMEQHSTVLSTVSDSLIINIYLFYLNNSKLKVTRKIFQLNFNFSSIQSNVLRQ